MYPSAAVSIQTYIGTIVMARSEERLIIVEELDL